MSDRTTPAERTVIVHRSDQDTPHAGKETRLLSVVRVAEGAGSTTFPRADVVVERE